MKICRSFNPKNLLNKAKIAVNVLFIFLRSSLFLKFIFTLRNLTKSKNNHSIAWKNLNKKALDNNLARLILFLKVNRSLARLSTIIFALKDAFGKDAAFLLTVGSFLLTVELFCLQLTILAFLLTIGASLLTIFSFSAYTWSFFAYNGNTITVSAEITRWLRNWTRTRNWHRRSPYWECKNWSDLNGVSERDFWKTGPSAEMCRGFLLYKFWRILPGIFLGDFSGQFFPTKWGEKIRRPKNINPRKIRTPDLFRKTESGTGTAGNRPFQEPKPEPSFPVELYCNTEKPSLQMNQAGTENRNRSNCSTPKP